MMTFTDLFFKKKLFKIFNNTIYSIIIYFFFYNIYFCTKNHVMWLWLIPSFPSLYNGNLERKYKVVRLEHKLNLLTVKGKLTPYSTCYYFKLNNLFSTDSLFLMHRYIFIDMCILCSILYLHLFLYLHLYFYTLQN